MFAFVCLLALVCTAGALRSGPVTRPKPSCDGRIVESTAGPSSSSSSSSSSSPGIMPPPEKLTSEGLELQFKVGGE